MMRLRGLLAVIGTACVYFAMGLYFSSGNTAIYLTSYLRHYSGSTAQLSDSIWFLAAVGLSALILPLGGWLDSIIGVRAVCLIAGLLQSLGIFATYYALETTFTFVVLCYGGSFLISLGIAYTAPLANINKWFPERKGLVTGIAAAAMASAPTAWTPLITAYVNPNNIPPDSNGYFHDPLILERTRQSLLVQGSVTMALFLVGVSLIFPAPTVSELEKKQGPPTDLRKQVLARKISQLRDDDGLTPQQAIKTVEFFILSLKIMLTELVFYYLLFVYKPFGQTFIKDDFYLSSIGACAAVANTLCRLFVGHLKDLTTYKICCIPLSGLASLLVISLPFTSTFPPYVYGVWVVACVGIIGSQYALMPSAITEAFGERYASINIGLVYMSTVIADIAGALGSQFLTKWLGWSGMIAIIGTCTFIDFLSTFFLPNDPKSKLKERLLELQYNDEGPPELPSKDYSITIQSNYPSLPPYNSNFENSLCRRTSVPKDSDKTENDNEATRL